MRRSDKAKTGGRATDRAAADGVARAGGLTSGSQAAPLPEVPSLDSEAVVRRLTGFIRDRVSRAGRARAIVGISGGIDSAVVAALCVKALGADRVAGVILPYRTTSALALEDASLAARWLGITPLTVEISPMVDGYLAACSALPLPAPAATPDKVRIGNLAARQRMAVLFDLSQALNGLVAGTSNKSEILLGYGTLFGDTACSFNPLGDLYKTQVRMLAAALDVPERILAKVPTADLWPGQTDEGEIGITYDLADRLLHLLVDLGASRADVRALAGRPAPLVGEALDLVVKRVVGSQFKRRLPPIAWVSTARGQRGGAWYRRDYAVIFRQRG